MRRLLKEAIFSLEVEANPRSEEYVLMWVKVRGGLFICLFICVCVRMVHTPNKYYYKTLILLQALNNMD